MKENRLNADAAVRRRAYRDDAYYRRDRPPVLMASAEPLRKQDLPLRHPARTRSE